MMNLTLFIIAIVGMVVIWYFYDPKENDLEMKVRLIFAVIGTIACLVLIMYDLLK